MTLKQAIAVYQRQVADFETSKGEVEAAQGDVGRALRAERRRQGITLRMFAERLGCSLSMLSDLERGRRWSKPIIASALRLLA